MLTYTVFVELDDNTYPVRLASEPYNTLCFEEEFM